MALKPSFNNAASPYTEDDISRLTELVRYSTKEAVSTFITEKGDAVVQQRDKDGKTMIQHATETGRTGVIDILMQRGANVDAPDNNGMTPLMSASLRGFTKMVQFLVERGANIEAQDKKGMTPLMHAAYHKASRNEIPVMSDRKKATISFLLSKNASLDAEDSASRNAEERAERGKNRDALRIMTEERQRRMDIIAKEAKEMRDTVELLRTGTTAAIIAPRTATFKRPPQI
ncbi:MAG: ankyrin repeat domain-containing protein [bacterium]|nr:ankyrin repeat domain-containing protein [bacterium]